MNNKHSHPRQYTYAEQVRDDHNFEPTYKWLTDRKNVPTWHTRIPKDLGIDEPLEGRWLNNLSDFLAAPFGRIVWHMFAVSAYHCPRMEDIDKINKTVVVNNVNVGGNSVLIDEEVSRIILEARKKRQVILPPGIDASFARLFNWHEGFKKNRLPLFKVRPRHLRTTYSDCSVCGTRQNTSGLVLLGDGPKREITQDMVANFDPAKHVMPDGGIHYERTDNRI